MQEAVVTPSIHAVSRDGARFTRSFTAMVASAFFTGMGTTVLSCMAGDGLKTAISKKLKTELKSSWLLG